MFKFQTGEAHSMRFSDIKKGDIFTYGDIPFIYIEPLQKDWFTGNAINLICGVLFNFEPDDMIKLVGKFEL